jgi:hypothetical protein
MKRLSLLTAVLVVAAGFAAPASAAGTDLKGPHYNLNILGKENPKTATMTGSDQHTIFVALNNQSGVPSRIYLTPGEFKVCDGNAFDALHDCAGATVQGKQGALFQLPCNSNVSTVTGCALGIPTLSYEVWGRALGKPGGSVNMTTCGTGIDPITLLPVLVCSTGNTVEFQRKKGKSPFDDVTKELTTVNACFTVDGVETCTLISLFDLMLQDYFWQYDNKGLRLLQLRFYPL